VGEHFGFDARFDVSNVCFESEDIFYKVHDLVSTPLEECRDECAHEESPNLGFNNVISPNPFDHLHVFPTCSQPPISLEYSLHAPINNPKICDSKVDLEHAGKMFAMLGENVDNFISLGYFFGHGASLDPYCIFLVDKPRKIIWNTFFGFSFDLSMALALLKRALTFFAVIIFELSYCHA